MGIQLCLVPSPAAFQATPTARPFERPAAAEPASNSGDYAAIDRYVEQQMRRLHIPGVALAVVAGDRIVYQRGFGRARPGGGPPSPQTPFVLGSTTKSFTALAIMQLVEAGQIDLDAPVQRYLPWFRVADATASAAMTVRHLLNQTSGFPMLAGMQFPPDGDASLDAVEREVRALSTLKLTRPVGAAWAYSNLNYDVLGLIIEAVSGEAYAQYIERHIFTPLDMRHSYTSRAAARQAGLAVGHRYWFAYPVAAPKLSEPGGTLPAGLLIASAEDMAHWLIAHLNAGRYGDARILSPAGMEALHQGAADMRVMDRSVGGYGMGWFVERIGQTLVVWHSGNVPEFSSYMALLPEQKKGVVLLVNADHYGLPFVLPEMGAGVAALLAGQEPPPVQLGFIPWAMRALLLIPLVQAVGVAATLRRLRAWRRASAARPTDGRGVARHVLLPLVPNLALAATPALLRAGRLDRYLRLYNPDIYWTTRACGGFAGVWAVLRTAWLLRALRRTDGATGAPPPQAAPAEDLT